MALEQPRLFFHFHEIESRENVDLECSVTRENFKSLVGEYQLPEDVICQVQQLSGNCGHKHRRGWLGRITDGREGLIGGHCAVKYFNAHKQFATERNRVRREISISRSLETLHSLLDDEGEFALRLDTQRSRLRSLRQSRTELESNLPDSVVTALENMAKTGNRSVSVQIQYREIDEDGIEKNEWIDQSVGAIAGQRIWSNHELRSLFAALKEIKSALDDLVLSRDAGERKLKKWAESLIQLPAKVSQIDEVQREFEQFTDSGNLSLLVFLTRTASERIDVAKIALAFGGNRSPSSGDAKHLIDELERRIRQNNGNRNIRVLR